jgi:hypothetical protein
MAHWRDVTSTAERRQLIAQLRERYAALGGRRGESDNGQWTARLRQRVILGRIIRDIRDNAEVPRDARGLPYRETLLNEFPLLAEIVKR